MFYLRYVLFNKAKMALFISLNKMCGVWFYAKEHSSWNRRDAGGALCCRSFQFIIFLRTSIKIKTLTHNPIALGSATF